MRVRDAVPADAEAIADVQVRSFQAGYVHMHPPEVLAALDPAPRVPLWREREGLVAERDGAVVGLVQAGPSDEASAGEIYRLFVDPEHWGAGAGRALMARAQEQLRAAGFGEALLWVQESLGRTVRLLCYRLSLR